MYMRFPISLHTSPWSIAALMGVKQYSLQFFDFAFSNDMEHLFQGLFVGHFYIFCEEMSALCTSIIFQDGVNCRKIAFSVSTKILGMNYSYCLRRVVK